MSGHIADLPGACLISRRRWCCVHPKPDFYQYRPFLGYFARYRLMPDGPETDYRKLMIFSKYGMPVRIRQAFCINERSENTDSNMFFELIHYVSRHLSVYSSANGKQARRAPMFQFELDRALLTFRFQQPQLARLLLRLPPTRAPRPNRKSVPAGRNP